MINPIVFRLGKKKDWYNKIIEKKSNELKNYIFKKSQLTTYIYIFFKKYLLLIKNLIIYYKKHYLNFFVCYNVADYNFFFKIKRLKIKFIKKLKLTNNKLKLLNFNLKKLKHYFVKTYIKKVGEFQFNKFLIILNFKRLTFFKFIDFLKFKFKNLNQNTHLNNFVNKLFFSLCLFLNNIKILKVTLKQIINNYSYKSLKVFKKSFMFNLILNLRKFEKFNFFYNVLNFLVYIVKLKFKAKLVSDFITYKLITLKKWYDVKKFLNFFENILFNFLIKQFKYLKIKIVLKGIFIKNKRSSKKIIQTDAQISNSLINQQLDYFQNVCFTNKGTIGVKVFISEK